MGFKTLRNDKKQLRLGYHKYFDDFRDQFQLSKAEIKPEDSSKGYPIRDNLKE